MTLTIGEVAPTVALLDTDGSSWTIPDAEQVAATVVAFTCNHCPYAIAWHERILDAARDYAERGVRFLLVNSNDGDRYPRDSYEAMRERVAREHWAVPYLWDETQDVARAFGAQTTPDLFVLDSDGALRYRGAPDADHHDPSQHAAWLRQALDTVLAGGLPDPSETKPVGCSIKWKP